MTTITETAGGYNVYYNDCFYGYAITRSEAITLAKEAKRITTKF